ncbi:MAG: malate synthase A, partial [Thermoplasmatota archaeon]
MRTTTVAEGVEAALPLSASHHPVLTAEAVAFVTGLHEAFEPRRQELLQRRRERQGLLDAGGRLGFLPETAAIREGHWRVAPPPADLADRRVEITGPPERKLMINALNSGAKVFMADFEDSLSPTWANVLDGQANVMDAVRGTLSHVNAEGRLYAVRPDPATLVVRPRGLHLDEAGLKVHGVPVAASLFDFGLFAFHNAKTLLFHGSGPYLYLAKMESHLEARLWADVFRHAEASLGIPENSIRATVLIETLPAAFEMEEILHELRERSPALNAGRWDYLFSAIKTLRAKPGVLPDRADCAMTTPFLWAYTQRLVQACHKRGAYAIGGMSAYVPDRRDAARNEAALAKVRDDKTREAGQGFDGAWVAHPGLVPVAMAAFKESLGERTNQLAVHRDEATVGAADLLFHHVPSAAVTEAGLRANVRVCLAYLSAWLGGQGAVAIDSLMEDTATAEIARTQVWQWVRQGVVFEDARTVTPE